MPFVFTRISTIPVYESFAHIEHISPNINFSDVDDIKNKKKPSKCVVPIK